MSIFSQSVDIVTDMECPICTEMSRDGHMVQSPYLGPNLVYVGPHCSRCHRRIEEADCGVNEKDTLAGTPQTRVGCCDRCAVC